MAVIIKYPSTIACRAAGIDKQRFNEAVAHRRYTCAPEVLKGGVRSFYENDVLALSIFARLCEKNFPPSLAGQIACGLLAKLNQFPDAGKLSVPIYEDHSTGITQDTNGRSAEGNESKSTTIEMSFDIKGIRAALKPVLWDELSKEYSPKKRK